MTRASGGATALSGWRLALAGDSAAIFRVGRVVGPTAHRRVMRLLARLDAAHLPGVLDLVPAYASILVHFDPLLTDAAAIEAGLRATPDGAGELSRAPARTIHIPVRYGGEAGPDLSGLAERNGLTPADAIRLHTDSTQRVYFIGFLAGFPYLGNLPRALTAARLDVPRERVPAGSVAVAGRQTGIYPIASPGGWRLIGRCNVVLFDPSRDPPAVLHPGDRVRFVASADEPAETRPDTSAPAYVTASAPYHDATALSPLPWLRVVRPGVLTTVQDAGRRGYARSGVALAGAVDRDALALGNLLVSNPMDAAALEVTFGALTCETLAPCVVALTGAESTLRVNGRPRPMWTALALAPGSTVSLDAPHSGVRSYLCVAGGVAVVPVLGSRATDPRGGFGGFAGRALHTGDVLERGAGAVSASDLAGRQLPADPVRAPHEAGAPITLRILPGPHARRFPRDLAALCAATFAVDPRSDRVGVRLRRLDMDNPAAEQSARVRGRHGGEALSEGVPDGAIQLPPGGEPILLLSDHQTTGGYHIPAVVISADHWRGAQLRPGDRVRLVVISVEEARAALRARARWLASITDQLARAPAEGGTRQAPDLEVLMRGFAEGSEEAGDDG